MAEMGDGHRAAKAENSPDRAETVRQELLAEITRLNRLSMRGVLALSLFLTVCILAWWDFSFLPSPEAVTAVLGRPPSSRIISIALLVYSFSAIILSLCRMAQGIEHKSSFCHVGYLSVFFLFYYCTKSLEQNYWAVFAAGITILGVEGYRIWAFCSEASVKIQDQLAYLTRTGRLPPQD